MKIVFVHGRAQEGRSEGEIRDEWLKALNAGLSSIQKPTVDPSDVIVPYYGDALLDMTETWGASVNDSKRSSDEAAFLAEAATEILGRVGAGETIKVAPVPVDPNGKRVKGEIGGARTEVDIEQFKRGIQNWSWVVDAVRFLDERFPELSTWTISKILRDVHIYLKDEKIRTKIDAIVEVAIPDEPFVMVAHSLGTVVAYNVLRRSKRNFNGLITLGSPLGIGAVRSRLDPQPVTRPAVTTWTNLFDPADIVALNPLNSESFARFDDIKAILDVAIYNTSDNRHNITPYLSHAASAGRIFDALNEGKTI